jgi:hypothetical protein
MRRANEIRDRRTALPIAGELSAAGGVIVHIPSNKGTSH